MPPRRLTIVTPVLDDWDAFQRLVVGLAAAASTSGVRAEVIAVDDGSSRPPAASSFTLPAGGALASLAIVRLALNLGHQRAIAIGLAEAASRGDGDAVLVMDSDGEDRPEDVPALLAALAADPAAVIFAQRARRSESVVFKLGHAAYKLAFRLLAGRTVDFGNFSLLTMPAVERLTHMPELWNNLPAAVMRSRLAYRTVPTTRGTRYSGVSKMNWVALVLHGMSALSVYTDVIFVRLLFAAGVVAALAVLGIVAAIVIRVATSLAIPGWATTVVGVFSILLVQMVVAVAVTALSILAGRSGRPFVPKYDCAQFIAGRERIDASP